MRARNGSERGPRFAAVGRFARPSETAVLLGAVLVLVIGTVVTVSFDNGQVKVASFALAVMVVASLALSERGVAVLLGCVVITLLVVLEINGWSSDQVSPSGWAVLVIVGTVVWAQARRRSRLGLRQVSAETVISLIGDRLTIQSEMPALPGEWLVEVEQRPADGAAISGDFVSNRLVETDGRPILHLAIIDVSGSGISAGPRALLLSGAIGGLLGAVPPDELLPAANHYLTRQRWSLGFASAVYLRLDLSDGRYEVRVAGHPPPLHLRPDTDERWQPSQASGTVLGVVSELNVEVDRNQLRPGDALVLFTDGVVEDRERDLDDGLARLRDRAELLQARRDWRDGARFLVENVPTKSDDDRTVVVVTREIVVPSDAEAGPQSGAAGGASTPAGPAAGADPAPAEMHRGADA